jgi:hypothetical protein
MLKMQSSKQTRQSALVAYVESSAIPNRVDGVLQQETTERCERIMKPRRDQEVRERLGDRMGIVEFDNRPRRATLSKNRSIWIETEQLMAFAQHEPASFVWESAQDWITRLVNLRSSCRTESTCMPEANMRFNRSDRSD